MTTRIPSEGSVPDREAFREEERDSTSSSPSLHLHPTTDQDEQHGAFVTQQVMDVVEQLHHQLSALAKPLAEQTVAVDLDERDVVEAGKGTNGQLLSESTTQGRLSGSGRAVEKKNAIQRDDAGIDIVEGKDKGGSRIVEQITLYTLVIHETTLKQIERTY